MSDFSLKKAAVVKMLAGFPSFLRHDEAMAKLVVGAYLDVLDRYDVETVANACQRCIAQAGAWQPSAAEVRKACEDILAARAAAEIAARPRLAPPARGLDAIADPVKREEARKQIAALAKNWQMDLSERANS